MASLQQRGEWFHLLFRYRNRQYSHALKTKDRREAEALRGVADRTLIRLRRRELPPPAAGIDVPAFILAGGHLDDAGPVESGPPPLTLGGLRDRYLATHANGAVEPKTLVMAGIHFRHLIRFLGEKTSLPGLTQGRVQAFLDHRATAKGKTGQPVSPVTIQKDIATLRAAWNWAVRAGLLAGSFPGRGLTYPKTDEKPGFQTRADIERKLARGGLTPAEVADLWAGLFLTREEIAEFLAFVKQTPNSPGPHLYPMVCFAAHTGARRSEVLRLRIDDIDLETGFAVVRERKKNRGHRTTRRVPLSGFLRGVLADWLACHPGGQYLFCRFDAAAGGPVPLSPMAAYDHFRRAARGSAWDVLRGWHALRHSFISVCAAEGVDQRVLQGWVGHLSAATHKRYTHLIPGREREIIGRVFG